MKTALFFLLLLQAFWLAGCGNDGKSELTVYTGAGLTDVMQEIGLEFQKESGVTVRCNFQPAGTLKVQIERGAPADIFIAPHPSYMDSLEAQGLLEEHSRMNLLSNRIVCVAPLDSTLRLEKIDDIAGADAGSIALPDPNVAAVGVYTKESRVKLDLWERVADRVKPTLGVRAALAAVEGGNADSGFVFRTDAMMSKKVRIAFELPSETHSEILFPAAILAGSENKAVGKEFMRFLCSDKAKTIFRKHGFIPAMPDYSQDDTSEIEQ